MPWGPCVGFHAALPRGPPSCEYENLRGNHVCRHEANCFFFGNPHRKTVLFFGIDPGREDFRCSTRPGPALMRRKLFCPEIIFLPPRGNLFLFWEPTSQNCSFFWDRPGTRRLSMQHSAGARPHEKKTFLSGNHFFAATRQSVSFLGTHIANLFFFLGLPFTCWHSGHRVGGPWKISCVLPGAAHPNFKKTL